MYSCARAVEGATWADLGAESAAGRTLSCPPVLRRTPPKMAIAPITGMMKKHVRTAPRRPRSLGSGVALNRLTLLLDWSSPCSALRLAYVPPMLPTMRIRCLDIALTSLRHRSFETRSCSPTSPSASEAASSVSLPLLHALPSSCTDVPPRCTAGYAFWVGIHQKNVARRDQCTSSRPASPRAATSAGASSDCSNGRNEAV